MRNEDKPKKVLIAVLLTYMTSSGISINLSNSSINYIENQSNNYYYLKDDKKT